MTKPANFPERVRQRRLAALHRLSQEPKAKERPMEWRLPIIAKLHERTATPQFEVRTKKLRGQRRAAQ